jgi:hypothetical protein
MRRKKMILLRARKVMEMKFMVRREWIGREEER